MFWNLVTVVCLWPARRTRVASGPDCVAIAGDGDQPINHAHGASGGGRDVVIQAAMAAAGPYANDPSSLDDLTITGAESPFAEMTELENHVLVQALVAFS